MLGISLGEWMIIALVIIVVMRPSDIPVVLKTIAKIVRYVKNIQREISLWLHPPH